MWAINDQGDPPETFQELSVAGFWQFSVKKDQICGIFSCKQTLHRAGNITNLVFLPETHCYNIEGTLGTYLKLNAN